MCRFYSSCFDFCRINLDIMKTSYYVLTVENNYAAGHFNKETAQWLRIKTIGLIWCERGDSNPHGVTTRTSNVLVYHSNTLASVLKYYTFPDCVCQHFFPKPLQIRPFPATL